MLSMVFGILCTRHPCSGHRHCLLGGRVYRARDQSPPARFPAVPLPSCAGAAEGPQPRPTLCPSPYCHGTPCTGTSANWFPSRTRAPQGQGLSGLPQRWAHTRCLAADERVFTLTRGPSLSPGSTPPSAGMRRGGVPESRGPGAQHFRSWGGGWGEGRARLTGAGPCSGPGPGCSSDGRCGSSPGRGCRELAPLSPPRSRQPAGRAGTASVSPPQRRSWGPAGC